MCSYIGIHLQIYAVGVGLHYIFLHLHNLVPHLIFTNNNSMKRIIHTDVCDKEVHDSTTNSLRLVHHHYSTIRKSSNYHHCVRKINLYIKWDMRVAYNTAADTWVIEYQTPGKNWPFEIRWTLEKPSACCFYWSCSSLPNNTCQYQPQNSQAPFFMWYNFILITLISLSK